MKNFLNSIIFLFIVAVFFITFRVSNFRYTNWKDPMTWVEEGLPTYLQNDSQKSRVPAATASYKISGECGGLPKIDIKTAPGFCLGIIDDGSDLFKPRYTIELSNGDLVLSDMVSWDPMKGKIYYYKNQDGDYKRTLIFSNKTINTNDPRLSVIDRPNQLLIGPDNLVYIGSASGIFRFNPNAADKLASLELVVKNLPSLGLHALKAMAFNSKRQLFVNVGSATNVCEKMGYYGKKLKSCPEVEDLTNGQGQIRVYQMLSNGYFDPDFKVYAKGVRNSMAMLFDEDRGQLLQVENGRDAINKHSKELLDSDFPHEEMNWVEEGKHYGWPYCFDNNIRNPEWAHISCKNYKTPFLLLPPHSAPLGMIKYTGNSFPERYKNSFIVSFHGYASTGHRLVTFAKDERGLPAGNPLSLVYDWKTESEKPGTPVGLFQMKDGSVLVTEDNNRKVLKLIYDSSQGGGAPLTLEEEQNEENQDSHRGQEVQSEIELENKLAEVLRDFNGVSKFAKFQAGVIDKQCIMCHAGQSAPGIRLKKFDYLENEKIILDNNKALEIYGRISGDPNFRVMPPQGFMTQKDQDQAVLLFVEWMEEQGIDRPEK